MLDDLRPRSTFRQPTGEKQKDTVDNLTHTIPLKQLKAELGPQLAAPERQVTRNIEGFGVLIKTLLDEVHRGYAHIRLNVRDIEVDMTQDKEGLIVRFDPVVPAEAPLERNEQIRYADEYYDLLADLIRYYSDKAQSGEMILTGLLSSEDEYVWGKGPSDDKNHLYIVGVEPIPRSSRYIKDEITADVQKQEGALVNAFSDDILGFARKTFGEFRNYETLARAHAKLVAQLEHDS